MSTVPNTSFTPEIARIENQAPHHVECGGSLPLYAAPASRGVLQAAANRQFFSSATEFENGPCCCAPGAHVS